MHRNERFLINTELLRTFLSIAKCGNLTVAAGQLGRTQSAISVQLRKLETGLGVVLFKRTSKGMMLTSAGDALLPRAHTILAGIREASALFDVPLSGSIRVGLPDDFGEAVLQRILIAFSRAHPGVNVVATSGCTSGYAAQIVEGALDIVVCSGPHNDVGETLGMEEVVWVAKAGMQINRDQPVPLAILDRYCWWHDLPVKSLDSVGRDHTVTFRSSNFASLLAAVRSGFAISVLPGSSLCDDTVRLRPADGFPELPQSRRSILIATGAQGSLTRAMATAIREAWT